MMDQTELEELRKLTTPEHLASGLDLVLVRKHGHDVVIPIDGAGELVTKTALVAMALHMENEVADLLQKDYPDFAERFRKLRDARIEIEAKASTKH